LTCANGAASEILETSELSENISKLSENLVHRKHVCICFVTTVFFSREAQAEKFFQALDEVQDSIRQFEEPE
jgi:hypothetical protein